MKSRPLLSAHCRSRWCREPCRLAPDADKTSKPTIFISAGRLAFDRFDKKGFDRGSAIFGKSLQLDPESALAPAWLAIAYIWAEDKRFVEHGTGFEEARRSAERARMLDPRSELAMGALGLIHVFYDWDWSAATTDLDHALALAPGSARTLFYHGLEMTALGKWETAIRDLNASAALDPLLSPAHFSLGRASLGAGRLERGGSGVEKSRSRSIRTTCSPTST